jgi:hypothetical protein
MGEMISPFKILVRKPEGRKPLRIPRRRWEDNIRLDLREIMWEDVDWIYLAQDRDQWRVLVNTAMNFRVLLKAGNVLISCVIISFSRRTLLHRVSK